jgi:hypothetical protein
MGNRGQAEERELESFHYNGVESLAEGEERVYGPEETVVLRNRGYVMPDLEERVAKEYVE